MSLDIKSIAKQLLLFALSAFPEPAKEHRGGGTLHLRWRRGWIRGQFLKIWWGWLRLPFGPRIICGNRLAVQGRLRLRGQGTIIFGDDVVIDSITDLYTQSPNAVIRVGDRTFLNGTRVSCVEQIHFGTDVIAADARILDTDFHVLSRDRHGRQPIPSAPVYIEDNVWLAMGSIVLKGVRIGRDSVIASAAVVVKDVPPGRIYGGNPARDIGPVPD